MTNLLRHTFPICLATVVVSAPARATAQESPLAGHLTKAIAAAARMDPTSVRTIDPAADHTMHFLFGAARTTLPADLNSALGMQVSLFPVAVPSDGLMYSSEGGEIPNRLRMGASFVERANTVPRGKFTWGFNRQSDNYSKLDGIDLERGELVLYSQHDPGPGRTQVTESPNDVLEQTVSLDFDRNVFAFWGSVGVTDRFELDFVVPVVKVSMDTRIVSRIERAVPLVPIIHAFNELLELNTRTTFLSDSATGLGDVAVRAKGGLYRSDRSAVAAAVTVQLPTGDEDELLGSGAYRTQAQFLWSGDHGRVGSHFNAGYTFSFGEASSALVATPEGAPANAAAEALDLDIPAEINFTGGVDVGLSDYVTLVLGARGRYLFEATRFDARTTQISGFQASNALVVTGRGESLTQAFAVIGTVIRLGSRFQANADILLPVLNNGLVPNVTGLGGFSWAF
jgi:hypothetical protein